MDLTKPETALELLTKATESISATRLGHMQIVQALETMKVLVEKDKAQHAAAGATLKAEIRSAKLKEVKT